MNTHPHPSLILIGLSHHTTPIELRERFGLEIGTLNSALVELQGDVLRECAILSTCNRLEVYAWTADREQGWQIVEDFFARLTPVNPTPYLYRLCGVEAVDHLMRVACGLEAMILGESQILGQVRDALDAAHSAGTSGAILSHLISRAIHTGKRARTETAISQFTTSISHAAARLVQQERGKLTDLHVLVIGAGDMAALAARALQMNGASRITIINRSMERAEALATSIGAQAADWEQMSNLLPQVDVIISATGAPHTVLYVDHVESALPTRSGRPLLVIDIAVPRDIDPAVVRLPDVRCFNIDDLQATLDEHYARRTAAVPMVEAIIREERLVFLEWLHNREVAPVISDLYRHALSVVDAEIERALHKLGDLTPHEQKVVTQLGSRIANKLLHEPTIRLKAAAVQGSGLSYAHLIRELFALEEAYSKPTSQEGCAASLEVCLGE